MAPTADPLIALISRMAKLLLALEADAFADARPCPFCHAPESSTGASALPHAAGCELDGILEAVGARRPKPGTGLDRPHS